MIHPNEYVSIYFPHFWGFRASEFLPWVDNKSGEMWDSFQKSMEGTGPQLEPDKPCLCAISFLPRPVRVHMALSGLAKSDACSRGPPPLEVRLNSVTERFRSSRSFLGTAAVGMVELSRNPTTAVPREKAANKSKPHTLLGQIFPPSPGLIQNSNLPLS